MKKPSDYGKEQDPSWKGEGQINLSKAKKRSRKKLLITSVLLLLGISGGVGCGWFLLQRKLIPFIETELTKFLHRPIEVGPLESLSFQGARLGKSDLPATPTNPDYLTAEGVQIDFNLWQFLLKRNLKLNVSVIKPEVYLEQDEQGIWTPTNFGTEEEQESWIKVDVETLKLQKADVTLVARAPTGELNAPVPLKLDQVTASFLPGGDIIEFEVEGELDKGGDLSVDGQVINTTGAINLDLVGQDMIATEVANLLNLPVELEQGKVGGQLAIELPSNQDPQLKGTADLNNVTWQIPGLVKPFSNSNGKLHFNGSEIEFDRLDTTFGEVVAVANGSLNTAGEGNYQIKANTQPIEINKVIEALELEKPIIEIAGKIRGDITVTGSLFNPITSFDITSTSSTRIDKVDFQSLHAQVDLVGNDLLVKQFQGKPKVGGEIKGTGKIELDGNQNLFFDVQAQNVPGTEIARNYNDNLPIEIGLVSGSAKFLAQADSIESLQAIDGEASFPLGGGTVIIDNLQYGTTGWESQVKTVGVDFASLPIGKNSAPNIGKGKLNSNLQVTSNQQSLDLTQLTAKGTANLKTVGGEIVVPNLTIEEGQWFADANTQELWLRQVFPELPPEFNGLVSGKFDLTGNVEGETQIDGVGNLTLAEGKVAINDFQVRGNDWQANAQATDLKLKELNSTTPDQFAGLVSGTFKLAGDVDNVVPEAIRATGDGSLTLPEGVFAATNLEIENGKFKTLVIPQGVDLSLFSDPASEDDLELNGKLRGKLNLTGKIDSLSPPDVQANGNVTFSQGIDLLEQAIRAKVKWNGKRLDVLEATGEGLEAKGYIDLDRSFFSDIPDKLAAIDYFYFDVPQAQWIDINKLRLNLPSWAVNLDYAGRTDFEGEISGIPSAMEIDGDLILRNFVVENLTFNPILRGQVVVSQKTGVNLNLAQNTDEIKLVLDKDFLPLAFSFEHEGLSVTGTGKGELVTLETANIPVDLLKIIAIKSDDFNVPENLAAQQIGGTLSGKFLLNLNTLATSGKNIVIEQPLIAKIRGERLTGDFQYADSYLALQNAKFKQRESVYEFAGVLLQKEDDLDIKGEVSVEKGQIQDVLIALEIFELSDLTTVGSERQYGTAKDLYNSPLPCAPEKISRGDCPISHIGLPQGSIFEQINRLAEIQAWLNLAQQNGEQRFLIPALKTLQGNFNGKILVAGSLQSGIDSKFKFQGEQWQWGSYTIEKVIADGDFSQGILTLLPISVQSQDSKITFSGSFGGETQSGQFRLINVPIDPIEDLVNLPPEIAFDGTLNATATLAGTPANPQARGEIIVAGATVNQTSIQETEGSFSYNNSRLNFFATSEVVANAEPITLAGSLPYKFPFAEVEPDSDRLNLQLNVKNEGLALLNILSRQEINWIDGEGEVTLDIAGIFDQEANLPRELVAKGTATVNNGKIAAKFLPEALLTEVNGNILFDFDHIKVERLTGNFAGGKVITFGTLPLTKNTPQSDPLTINLRELAINLKGLYQGGVRGKINILGAAIEPDITGELTLFDGAILIANTTNQSNITQISSNNGLAAATEYKNLELNLGNNIQIIQPPISNFHAEGTLKVNGTFNQPTPEGIIALTRGQVNLFTTQLSLNRSEENTARFTPHNGLDPFLDVILVGSAVETTPGTIPEDPLSSEINDLPASSLGSLQTVRISARVRGLASQLTNNIELTSNPPRSETEILGLLGGSFVNTLGRGDSTLGLANLAGSALFGSFNTVISDAFGLSEFRLFPTQIIDDNTERDRLFALAGEAAIDLTRNLSLSALTILTNVDVPPQFGFRYTIDDNFVWRGSTNFDDESRTSIEYEVRF